MPTKRSAGKPRTMHGRSHFGALLDAATDRKKMTYPQLAEAVGVSDSTAMGWRKRSTPNLAVYVRLLDALGIDPRKAHAALRADAE